MKVLSGCFLTLSLLSAVWLCGGLFITSQAPTYVNQIAAESKSTAPQEVKDASTAITSVLTGGVSLTFFLCTGVPAFMLSLMFGLVFYSMHTSERRHQEILMAQYARNDTLGNMATTQLAQAQMQYGAMERDRNPSIPSYSSEPPPPDPTPGKYRDIQGRATRPIIRGESKHDKKP